MSTVLQRLRHLGRFRIGDGEQIGPMILLRRGVFHRTDHDHLRGPGLRDISFNVRHYRSPVDLKFLGSFGHRYQGRIRQFVEDLAWQWMGWGRG